MREVVLPPVVVNKALACGAAQWLDELPALIAELEARWCIAVGEPYAGGTEAFVAPATSEDGTAAVLKVMVPREGLAAARHEIEVLRLTEGSGCAELLRADEELGAVLVERLGPSMHDLGIPMASRHEILCDLAQRVWRPAPEAQLPSGAEKAAFLAAFVIGTWEELDHPCSERAVDHAVAAAERRLRAHDDERAVLNHGDVHEWNALQRLDTPHIGPGFKLVDPDGLVAEAECDLGVLMREDPVELVHGDPGERARWLAHRTGLDAGAIWDWGVAERVSTGLLATKIGLQPVGGHMLAAADTIALSPDRSP